MTPDEARARVHALGGRLTVSDGRLYAEVPNGLDDDLRAALKEHKAVLLATFRDECDALVLARRAVEIRCAWWAAETFFFALDLATADALERAGVARYRTFTVNELTILVSGPAGALTVAGLRVLMEARRAFDGKVIECRTTPA